MNPKIYTLVLVFIFYNSGLVFSQNILTGMVADSATMQPLPNVNIKTKNRSAIAISDIRGYFSIPARDDDTIVFSMVGYYSKALPVKWISEVVVIFLPEEQKVLETIEINLDSIPPWFRKLPPESPWKNRTHNIGLTDPPGYGGIPVAGPGYVWTGIISHFLKYEKERRKLKQVRQENYQSKDYVDLVNSPEVKNKIMTDYNLTEEEYYRLLATFNEKNTDIIYELEPNDLISVLLTFYGENAKKK